MRFSLKRITSPAIEPVSVADVKLHTHIDYDVEDDIIAAWIKSARIMAEDYQRRAFIAQVWELSFDDYPELPLALPRAPLMGVSSIKIYDTANAETVLYSAEDDPLTTTEESTTTPETNADFYIDESAEPARVGFSYNATWPSTTLRSLDSVKIRYVAGYGIHASDVPANVRDAIMLYCAYRNENRAAETEAAPPQFFNLLNQDRLYL